MDFYPAGAGLGVFIDHDRTSKPQKPTAIPERALHPSNVAPTTIELDQLVWGQRYQGPSEPATGSQTPISLNELENSLPSTPTGRDAVEVVQTWKTLVNRSRISANDSNCF